MIRDKWDTFFQAHHILFYTSWGSTWDLTFREYKKFWSVQKDCTLKTPKEYQYGNQLMHILIDLNHFERCKHILNTL